MQAEQGKPAKKSPTRAVGVGRKKQPLFDDNEALSQAAAQLNQGRDEGEFCSPLPMDSITPDPDNSRKIIEFLSENANDFIDKESGGRRLQDLIADVDVDLGTISCSDFIDTTAASQVTGYEEQEIQEKWSNILQLARSIHFNGVKQPIEVRRNDGSRNSYTINYGHRRFLASRIVNAATIRSIIVNTDTKQDDLTSSVTRWAENRNNENLTFWEEYEDLKSIREGWLSRYKKLPSSRELAPRLSINRRTLDRINAVVKAEENGLLTPKLEVAIKNQWLSRQQVAAVIAQALKDSLDGNGLDALIDSTMESEGYQMDQLHQGTDRVSDDSQQDTKAPNVPKRGPKKPSASIKIKDVDFGRRIVSALSKEFKELGDINPEELNSIGDIRAVLRRLI